MKKAILFSTTLLVWVLAYTQSLNMDSLEKKIRAHPQQDTVRVKLIMDFAQKSQNENTSQLLPYLQEAVRISKSKKFIRGLQAAYIQIQSYYADREDAENASLYADTAFSYLQNDPSDFAQTSLAWLYNNVAGDYAKLADYRQAIEYLLKAAAIFEKIQPASLGGVYGNIASMYAYLLLPQRALEYDQKAIAAAAKAKDTVAFAQRNIGYAARLLDSKRFIEAEEVLNTIEPLVLKLNRSSTNTFFYQNRGLVKKSKGNYLAAIADLKKAYSYTIENKNILHQLTLLEPLTTTLIDVGKMDEAKNYLDTLLRYSIAYKIKEAELNAYDGLAEWYSRKNDYKIANQYLQKSRLLIDSVSSEEMKNKIAAMETRFRVQGKNNEIKKLLAEQHYKEVQIQKRNMLNYVLIGGIVVLAFLSFLTWRNYTHRKKIQQQRITELETEKQLAATEAVLKGEEQERSRLAKDLHDGLGGLLSGIKLQLGAMKGNLILSEANGLVFNNALNKLDESINEMRRVAHNMMPETLMKLGLKQALQDYCAYLSSSGNFLINSEFHGLEERMDSAAEISVYRIVQELLNNAIKHSGSTTILAQVMRAGNNLTITVEDNGQGFELHDAHTLKTAGLRNVRSRVNYLNGKMDILTSLGKGTSVYIECKIDNNE